MASPFLPNPVDISAQIVRRALRRERVFRDRQNPLDFPDTYLYERYRFSAEGICYICELLEPHIANVTRRSHALTVPQMVCIALRFFASGTYLYAIGDAENLGKNTVCRTIRKVVLALQGYINGFIVFPGHLSTMSIKEGFYKIAGFPRVIGAIDCTHVAISTALGEHEADYVNRKSFHSLNVQMTCDHECMITSLDAKWPGSVHDSRIFRESVLCQRFEEGLFDGLLVGDRGYACQRFLLTPHPDPHTGPQNRFNVALSKTRVKIEMTFGILKARFNCLRRLRVSPERASQIVAACAILHNIATIRKERVPPQNQLLPDEIDPITLDHPAGAAVRDAITTQYFT
ncbi:putative nuclease HARBI1 isoform X2 [Pseudorasbora parva]|uniref:putative nuclease HARBI1 isoform X2 n=1 Tax=Pseudorasbora parva TaxID=51549 RepID=UPI00351E0F32